jgi:two-component system, NtrC family, sensor kinase
VTAAVEHPLYRPVRARIALAAWIAALGALILLVLQLPLSPRFFALVAGWCMVATASLHWLAGRRHDPVFFPARFAVFAFEVVAAAWVAHYIGASSWLATLFLLFPAIEWNMLYPGIWGLMGSLLAVVASGTLIVGEAVGFVPAGAVFPAIDPEYGDPRYALAAFFVSGSVIVGLSTVVSGYAEAGRRQSRELGGANERLREMSEDVRRSHHELEKAYTKLGNTQAELVGAAKLASLGTLIAGVAHEINTPLGALNANHDTIRRALEKLQVILEDETVDEHELDDVRRIVRAIDGVTATNNMAVARMVKMVDSLRTFGRVDRSERDHVDLHEGIESTLAILKQELNGRSIAVVRDFGDLPLVECYPDQVNQVFMNLILNGAQAIRDAGTVTIRTRPAGDAVEVEIQDTGVGIPAENLARIYDPGFTTKEKRMGMGMGLLISRRIIDRHSGELRVDSEPGVGTTFTVRLPVRLQESTDDRPAASTATTESVPAAEAAGAPATYPVQRATTRGGHRATDH